MLFAVAPITHADDALMASDTGSADEGNHFIIGLALTTGGDELAQVALEYEDGSTSNTSIDAGGMIYFYGGMQFNDAVFPLRVILGYFTDSVDASNASVCFSRIPVELTALHLSGPHTFGVGLSYHISPELDLSDVGLGTYDADDAMGWLLMYEYALDGDLSIGLRYTDISYDFGGDDLNGNNPGLVFDVKF